MNCGDFQASAEFGRSDAFKSIISVEGIMFFC